MTDVFHERMAGRIDGDFVVFMLGMRVNRRWRFWQWRRVNKAMALMQGDLHTDPDVGLLSQHVWRNGGGTLLVQYWRTVEHLEKFAHNPDITHRPAWLDYYRRTHQDGAAGIWHETYLVGPGKYEAIYVNMPLFGLADAGEHLPVGEVGERAAERRAAV